MWERELMGLYISAHPLDNFATFLEEQTIPLVSLTPANDNQKATIGGIITTVRSIVTKSGSKMAFVGLEDKTGESEIIVFPDLYAQIGAKLAQDAVVLVSGKINAKDRDGNLTSEIKLIADTIQIVSDKELRDYESTGKKMAGLKHKKPRAAVAVTKKTAAPAAAPKPAKPVAQRVVYIHVEDPNNSEALRQLKLVGSKHPGTTDVVLVLGADKKSAIRLPFKIDDGDTCIEQLKTAVGQEFVVIK